MPTPSPQTRRRRRCRPRCARGRARTAPACRGRCSRWTSRAPARSSSSWCRPGRRRPRCPHRAAGRRAPGRPRRRRRAAGRPRRAGRPRPRRSPRRSTDPRRGGPAATRSRPWSWSRWCERGCAVRGLRAPWSPGARRTWPRAPSSRSWLRATRPPGWRWYARWCSRCIPRSRIGSKGPVTTSGSAVGRPGCGRVRRGRAVHPFRITGYAADWCPVGRSANHGTVKIFSAGALGRPADSTLGDHAVSDGKLPTSTPKDVEPGHEVGRRVRDEQHFVPAGGAAVQADAERGTPSARPPPGARRWWRARPPRAPSLPRRAPLVPVRSAHPGARRARLHPDGDLDEGAAGGMA